MERAIRSSDRESLEAEVVQLEGEIGFLRGDEAQVPRVKIMEETVASHKERLDMIKQQQLRVDQFLRQSDRCEASLHLTRMEMAALQADRSEASVGAVAETLLRTINQAKEVQEELKRLGY